MRINKHILNLVLFSLFGLLVVVPFGMIRLRTDSRILGEYARRDYYKRVVGDSENLMVRNIEEEGNRERDVVTALIPAKSTTLFYLLYEIANLTDLTEEFVIFPEKLILGEMKGKRVSLQLNHEQEVVLFNNDHIVIGSPELEFKLKPGEKVGISLIIENSQAETEERTITFDLILEKQ